MNNNLLEHFVYKTKFTAEFPEIATKFASLTASIMQDGMITAREKELIALGIAVGLRCLPCIHAHARSALSLGATPAAIFETGLIAICMAGEPGNSFINELGRLLDEMTSR